MRATLLSIAFTGASVVTLAGGCAPRLRAAPGEWQGPIENGKGMFEYRDGLNVSALAVSQPPIGTGRDFVAFGVHVHNESKSTFAVDLNRIRLGLGVGAQWAEMGPVPPDNLVSAYQSADASGAGVRELTAPELVRFVRHPRYCPYPYYPGYYYHGYPHYWHNRYYGYGYYDSVRDIYYRRQETAAFLARLLRSQEIPPHSTVGGFVVFSQSLHKREQYRLTVPLVPIVVANEPPAPTTPATTPYGGDRVFEFHFTAR